MAWCRLGIWKLKCYKEKAVQILSMCGELEDAKRYILNCGKAAGDELKM